MSVHIDGQEFEPFDGKIIEPTKTAMDKYGCRHGCEFWAISAEQLVELQGGKVLAFEINGGEYAGFIALDLRDDA